MGGVELGRGREERSHKQSGPPGEHLDSLHCSGDVRWGICQRGLVGYEGSPRGAVFSLSRNPLANGLLSIFS